MKRLERSKLKSDESASVISYASSIINIHNHIYANSIIQINTFIVHSEKHRSRYSLSIKMSIFLWTNLELFNYIRIVSVESGRKHSYVPLHSEKGEMNSTDSFMFNPIRLGWRWTGS